MRQASDFLMTSAQHRQWAAILLRKGKPEKASRHEALARFIERLEEREAELNAGDARADKTL